MSTIKVTNLRHESATGGNITLDSSGRVGIGQTSPTEKLHLSGSGGTAILVADSSDWAGLSLSGSGSSNFIVSDDRLDFLVNGSTRASILTTGGLTFSGDTAAANALDDYEEGTWTPALANSSGTTITAATLSGRYTKVGNLVTIYAYIFNVTGAFQRITGLPYTYWDGYGSVGRILSAGGGGNTPPTADGVDLLLTEGGTQLKMNTNNFSSTANVWLTLTYRAS